jgi:hypothetical protein
MVNVLITRNKCKEKEGAILNTLHFKRYYLSNMKNMHESTLLPYDGDCNLSALIVDFTQINKVIRWSSN